jgi:transposase
MDIFGRTRAFNRGIELALDETAGEARMQRRVTRYRVRLKAKPRRRLEALVRRRSPAHWKVTRARIVLLSHKGNGIDEIACALSVDHQVVRRWLKRYLAHGFDGLSDRPKTGRPTEIEPQVWQKLTTLVVQSPEKFGIPRQRWSIRALRDFLALRHDWQISRTSVSRFLRSMALKPHRLRYWLNPSDPDFDRKAAKICRLYVSPPARATVLSLDEKPGIQALRRLQPDRPLRKGKPARLEFEYERCGTRNLFAAFNIKTGHVVAWMTPDRSMPFVLAFLDHLVRFYRRGRLVIITDNISTRTGADASVWLRSHPRVEFVFTPKHGSWLNQVEIWFGILTRSALRYASFDSLKALERAILTFTNHWNNVIGHPFEWTYTGKVLTA